MNAIKFGLVVVLFAVSTIAFGCNQMAGFDELLDCKAKEEISSLAKARIFLVLQERGWKNIEQIRATVLEKKSSDSIDGRGTLYFSVIKVVAISLRDDGSERLAGMIAYFATYRRPYSLAMYFGGMELSPIVSLQAISKEDDDMLRTKIEEYQKYVASGYKSDLLNEKIAQVN